MWLTGKGNGADDTLLHTPAHLMRIIINTPLRGRYPGYAAQFLPAIEDALEANDLATARRYTSLLAGSLNAAAADAARACGCGP